MIDSFKNIERLRYKINKDLEELCNKSIDRIEKQNVTFLNESFCAIASAMAAFFLSESILQSITEGVASVISKCLVVDADRLSLVSNIISAIFCSGCLVVVASVLNKWLKKINQQSKNKKPEGIDNINYAKEFDNVACDSIFVSIEYKEMYVVCNDLDEKILYYLESMHYLEKALKIVEVLCARKDTYIISKSNMIGVEAYRVISILKVMKELNSFLLREIDMISIDHGEKIKSTLNELGEKIDEISKDMKMVA